MTRHTHRPTSPAGRLAAGRALRTAAALALPLGLLSACSVDLPTFGADGSSSSASGTSAPDSADAGPGTATDCSWLDQYIAPAAAINTGSDTHLIGDDYVDVRIANNLRTLTISGDSADVVAMNVDNIVINGSYANVYVCNVATITINTGATLTDVFWGPGVVPVVQDSGSYTTASAYTAEAQ